MNLYKIWIGSLLASEVSMLKAKHQNLTYLNFFNCVVCDCDFLLSKMRQLLACLPANKEMIFDYSDRLFKDISPSP